jgi:hypothetical protein
VGAAALQFKHKVSKGDDSTKSTIAENPPIIVDFPIDTSIYSREYF